MKKIFTLFAVACMALSVSAQEKVMFDPAGTYGNGATLTSENTKVVLGNDRTTKNYDLKLASVKAYCAELLGQTVLVENEEGVKEEKTRVVYVVGNQNPKDGELDGDKSAGSGYNPEKMNLPHSGTYYMITPATNGHITAFIVLNADKAFYVVKSNGEALPKSAITIKADGEEPTVVPQNDDNTINEKTTGTVEFDVVAGETYYVFCAGSKLSFGGYVFESTGDTPGPQPSEGSNVATDPALPITFNSWDANFLILKTGVSAGDKFVFTGEAIDVADWQWGPQILPKSNADWSDLGPALVPGADGKATFTLTEEYAKVINDNGGLRVQGMGVIVTTVNYEPAGEPQPEGDKVSIIDKFTYTWGAEKGETITQNADGSITFNSVEWGGAAAWLADNDTPADWSSYTKLVFVYAEPTTVNTQGFVQTTTENLTWWGNAGITSLECPFDGKDVTKVNQVALQASAPATIVIKEIYLVKSVEGIEELVSIKNVFDVNAPAYNLAGMRVGKDYKGVVIQNGHKFIQK